MNEDNSYQISLLSAMNTKLAKSEGILKNICDISESAFIYFDYEEKKHFVRHHAYDALNKDYNALVKSAGLDADFDESWLPKCNETRAERIKDFIWEKGFQLVGFPAKRLIDKLKK